MNRAAVVTVALLMSTSAVAEPLAPGPLRRSPYKLNLAVDLPVTGLAIGLSIPAFLELPPPSCLPSSCNPGDVNALDRTVIGNYSTTLKRTADFLVLGIVLTPLALDLIDTKGRGYLSDVMVYGEVLALTQALTQLTKLAVRRPTPFVYNEAVPADVRRDDPDAPRSFFSGHTASSFAAATAYTVTFWLRHPRSKWRWVVLGVAATLASTVGVLKVQAGYHFWTDIIAGAAVGTSLGVMVPLLHRW